MNPENDDRVSLNKVVSGSGFCSRREADNYIETGRVTINNKVARKGAWVKPGDVVAVDGEKIKSVKKNAAIYIALNKPVGITSTTDPKDKSNIIDYINYRTRIFPVGRLDKDSDGLIILTNDGDIVNKILRASNNHEKEYIVTVDKPVDEAFVRRMSEGVEILDEVTKKCYVRAEGARRFRIILTQGLNRQIRRMCEALGYKVHTLTRVRIMNISLDGLGVGKWRYFSASEIEKMNEIIAGSHNTDQQIPKTRAPKTRKEKPPVVAHDEEPTQPFDEYEVVRPTKKRKTGNQWWSNNINQKQKKEKPELEATCTNKGTCKKQESRSRQQAIQKK
jgi:23S rRNA pseudouridine2604 synthase